VFAEEAEYWLGWAFYDDNMANESIAQFQRMVKVYPEGKWTPQAMLTLGDILKKDGRVDEAIEWYRSVAEGYKGGGIANIANSRIGIILKAREQYTLALEYFRMALTGDNSEMNAQIQFDLAECYEKTGDIRRALEEYLKVEYRYPAGGFWLMRSRLKCAEILEAEKEFGKAYRMYEKLSRSSGKESEHAREKMEILKGYHNRE
jgi:cellulose synthase operon protein C